MAKIITISGKARHGKNATADIIKEKLELQNKKVSLIAMADYVKYICKKYYNWDGQKDEQGRAILQHLGTDIVRKKNPNFWVNIVLETINVLEDEFDYFIIPDCRFENEITELCKYFDVLSLKVVREGYKSNLTEEQLKHSSETALDNFMFDYILINKEGIESLKENIDILFNTEEFFNE